MPFSSCLGLGKLVDGGTSVYTIYNQSHRFYTRIHYLVCVPLGVYIIVSFQEMFHHSLCSCTWPSGAFVSVCQDPGAICRPYYIQLQNNNVVSVLDVYSGELGEHWQRQISFDTVSIQTFFVSPECARCYKSAWALCT